MCSSVHVCQIEGLEQDRVRLVSDKADLETTVTKLEKSLKDWTMERDDLLSQLDAEKVGRSAVLFIALTYYFCYLFDHAVFMLSLTHVECSSLILSRMLSKLSVFFPELTNRSDSSCED